MTHLLIAVGVFIAAHAIPAYRPVRDGLVRALGEVPYVVLYTVVSLGLASWVGYAYLEAPFVELWPFRPWQRWLPLLVMPVSCILLVAGLSAPNPFSVGAGSKRWDPARPGIVAVTRHPVMWGFVLWSGAHMLPNGDAASLVLFGLLTGLGLAGPASLDAKRRAKMGEDEWRRQVAEISGKTLAGLGGIGWARVLGGLLLYGALLHFHGPVIGVSPLPH